MDIFIHLRGIIYSLNVEVLFLLFNFEINYEIFAPPLIICCKSHNFFTVGMLQFVCFFYATNWVILFKIKN